MTTKLILRKELNRNPMKPTQTKKGKRGKLDLPAHQDLETWEAEFACQAHSVLDRFTKNLSGTLPNGLSLRAARPKAGGARREGPSRLAKIHMHDRSQAGSISLG